MFTCTECGMAYVTDSPADAEHHRRHHEKFTNGAQLPDGAVIAPIGRIGDFSICVVTRSHPHALREYAFEVATLLGEGVGFGNIGPSFDDKSDSHAFLALKDGRAQAILVLDRGSVGWSCTWQEYDFGSLAAPESTPLRDRWTVGFIAVNARQRRQGLARKLIRVGCGFVGCDFELLGWYEPFSPEGKALAKSLLPERLWIVK